MTQLAVRPMQWSKLDHIADVRPIDDSDAACLEEIRLVLQKHECLSRFGVSLLHSHFELNEDEMMLETTDLDRREHLVRPVKRSTLEEDGVNVQTTVIHFDDYRYSQGCGCNPLASGHHHK